MIKDAVKNAIQRTSLTLALVLPVLMACATPSAPAANEIKLNMDWREGQPTKHSVSFQLGIQAQFGNENGQKRDMEKNTTYAGMYTRKISKHEKGLLVSFSDVEVTTANPGISDIAPSRMQLAIGKISALLLVARPDFIMSPSGEFIALHDYEQYVADQRARFSDLIGLPKSVDIPKNSYWGMFDSITEAGLNQALLEEQIEQDLALVRDIDQLSLQLGEPLKTMITPAYTSKRTLNDKDGVKIEGMLSYNSNAKCQWKTNTPCVDIRFSMDDEKTYDVKMIIEPDTLTLHSFEATTDIAQEEILQGTAIKGSISSSFVHSVELK